MSIWKSHLGSQATYRALMEVFVRAGRMDCAKSVVEILKEGAELTDTPQAGTAETADHGDWCLILISCVGSMGAPELSYTISYTVSIKSRRDNLE